MHQVLLSIVLTLTDKYGIVKTDQYAEQKTDIQIEKNIIKEDQGNIILTQDDNIELLLEDKNIEELPFEIVKKGDDEIDAVEEAEEDSLEIEKSPEIEIVKKNIFPEGDLIIEDISDSKEITLNDLGSGIEKELEVKKIKEEEVKKPEEEIIDAEKTEEPTEPTETVEIITDIADESVFTEIEAEITEESAKKEGEEKELAIISQIKAKIERTIEKTKEKIDEIPSLIKESDDDEKIIIKENYEEDKIKIEIDKDAIEEIEDLSDIEAKIANLKIYDKSSMMDFTAKTTPKLLASKSRTKENIHIPIILKEADINNIAFKSIKRHDTETLRAIIPYLKNINAKNSLGDTLIIHATYMRYYDMIYTLASQGADVSLANNENNTALHIAIKNKDINSIKALIDMKANINKKDGFQKEPIFYAIEDGSIDIVELLLDKNPNLYCRDNRGNTPLEVARKLERGNIVEIIEKRIDATPRTSAENS